MEASVEALLENAWTEAVGAPPRLDWLECAGAEVASRAAGDGVPVELPVEEAESAESARARRPQNAWESWGEKRRDEELLHSFGRLTTAEDRAQFSMRWWDKPRRRVHGRCGPKGSRWRRASWEDLGQSGEEWRADWQAAAQRRTGVLGPGASRGGSLDAAQAAPDPLLVSGADKLLETAADPLLCRAPDPLTGESWDARVAREQALAQGAR